MSFDEQQLIDAAKAVRNNAHAPYSNYLVGAAVLDGEGRIHTGCNVENAAFPEGICAETNAIGTMVAADGKLIVAIAVVGGHDELEVCTPCGGCRQRIAEFAADDTQILLLDENESVQRYTVAELLPALFRLT